MIHLLARLETTLARGLSLSPPLDGRVDKAGRGLAARRAETVVRLGSIFSMGGIQRRQDSHFRKTVERDISGEKEGDSEGRGSDQNQKLMDHDVLRPRT